MVARICPCDSILEHLGESQSISFQFLDSKHTIHLCPASFNTFNMSGPFQMGVEVSQPKISQLENYVVLRGAVALGNQDISRFDILMYTVTGKMQCLGIAGETYPWRKDDPSAASGRTCMHCKALTTPIMLDQNFEMSSFLIGGATW